MSNGFRCWTGCVHAAALALPILLAVCCDPAAASSTRTTLCVVNQIDRPIHINANVINDKDWDGNSRPDKNFNDIVIAAYDSVCHREELANQSSAKFTMTIRIEDPIAINLVVDQKQAETKHNQTLGGSLSYHVDQASGEGTNGLYVRRGLPDNSDWMGNLANRRNDILLYQIAMPGSHDAGMYVTNDCTSLAWAEWAKTQDLSILNQLGAGARYFDLRPFSHNGTIYVGHFNMGQGCYGAKLQDILNDVRSFLSDAGGREVVFLKFSHTDNPGTLAQSVVKMVQDTFRDRLYKSDGTVELSNLKLDRVLGKVIAVFDCEYSSAINGRTDNFSNRDGIFHYIDKDFSGNDSCRKGYGTADGLTVYDVYAHEHELPKMIDDQLSKLNQYGGDNPGYLFLLSWTLTGTAGVLDVEALSAVSKPWLPQTLTGIASRRLKKANIIYYDFVDPWTNAEIIQLNSVTASSGCRAVEMRTGRC